MFARDGVIAAGYEQKMLTENAFVDIEGSVCVNSSEHDLTHDFDLSDAMPHFNRVRSLPRA